MQIQAANFNQFDYEIGDLIMRIKWQSYLFIYLRHLDKAIYG
jgi:hypothetical protein